MSIQSFLKKENIDTLWDVIIDEDIFKFLSKDVQDKVLKIFIENIKGFYETDKNVSDNLINMNKKYILLILNFIKKNYTELIPSKIKIHEDLPTKELITYEEIQNDKKTQFEKDFIKRQEEFTSSMTLVTPTVPEFADKFTDSPISEMDKMIKEITAKRNYDIEQINISHQNDVEHTDKWLKSQETSIKSEKITKPIISSSNKNLNEREKNVTWGINEEFYLSDEVEEPSFLHEDNIFNKLKKIKPTISVNTATDKSIEERIINIEKDFEIYKTKIDKILSLIENNQNM
jgi:hypothetical protein